MTGRASYILWENREIIDQMMQQMDDFASQNGGYINRSGVGNFYTKTVDEDDEENESPAEERKEMKMMMKKGKKGKMVDKDEVKEIKEAAARRRRRSR